jgi:integrase
MTLLQVGRPRSSGRLDLPDNLTPRPRKARDGSIVTYWYWRDPRSGAERPLRCPNDRVLAIKRAKELNALAASEMADQVILDLAATPGKRAAAGTPFDAYSVHYIKALHDRGELAANTLRSRKSLLNAAVRKFQDRPIHTIGVEDIAQLLKDFTDQGKKRTAQALRAVLIDIWTEAHQDGTLPADHPNPAEITRRPTAKVNRARLTLEDFNVILESAKKIGVKRGKWIPNSLLLALVTGQRREDLVIAQFRRGRDWQKLWMDYQTEREAYKGPHPYPHVHDGFFWIVQQKTGALVKIPLSLRLDAIGLSVGDVIEMCRSSVASRFLLHHAVRFGNAPLGSCISIDRVSHAFADARNATDLQWPGREPPTYHECRSLCDRLYEAQGVDTQSLLGHKHAKMTEVYADPRQAEWTTVAL